MHPIVDDKHGKVDDQRVLAAQVDPLVMHVVTPQRPRVPAGELLEHAAVAAVRRDQTFAQTAAWSMGFAEWNRSASRKVCVAAEPAQLEGLRTLSHAYAGEVVCLPPRRRSAVEPELAQLDAHTGGPLRPGDARDLNGHESLMVLLVAQSPRLTVGKACTQVAHAALSGRRLHRRSTVNEWEARGCPIAAALIDHEAFQRAKEEVIVVAVGDAGLTQIPAGTETILATEPGTELAEWLQAAARRIA